MKFGFVDEHRNLWPVRVMCAALDLSASGYYARRSRPESQRTCSNRALLQDIRQIHSESSGRYGSLRIHAALLRRGCRVGRCRIERLMRRAGLRGLAALPRRTRTTDSRHTYPIAPNRLARNFLSQRADQVWLADLTYIPTGEGWLPRCRPGPGYAPDCRLVDARDAAHQDCPGGSEHGDQTSTAIAGTDPPLRSRHSVRRRSQSSCSRGFGVTTSMSRKGNCLTHGKLLSHAQDERV